MALEEIPDYLSEFLTQGDYIGIPGEIVCIPGSDYVIVQPSSHFLTNPELYSYSQITKSWHLKPHENISMERFLESDRHENMVPDINSDQSKNAHKKYKKKAPIIGTLNTFTSSDGDNEQSSCDEESSNSSVYSGGELSEPGEDLSLADIAEPDPELFNEALEDISDSNHSNEDMLARYAQDTPKDTSNIPDSTPISLSPRPVQAKVVPVEEFSQSPEPQTSKAGNKAKVQAKDGDPFLNSRAENSNQSQIIHKSGDQSHGKISTESQSHNGTEGFPSEISKNNSSIQPQTFKDNSGLQPSTSKGDRELQPKTSKEVQYTDSREPKRKPYQGDVATCSTPVKKSSPSVLVVTLSPPNKDINIESRSTLTDEECLVPNQQTGIVQSVQESKTFEEALKLERELEYLSNLDSLEDEIPALPIIPSKKSQVVIQPLKDNQVKMKEDSGPEKSKSIPSVSIIPIRTSTQQTFRVHNRFPPSRRSGGPADLSGPKHSEAPAAHKGPSCSRQPVLLPLRQGREPLGPRGSSNTALHGSRSKQTSDPAAARDSNSSTSSVCIMKVESGSRDRKSGSRPEAGAPPPVIIPIFSKKNSASNSKNTGFQKETSSTPITISLITDNAKNEKKMVEETKERSRKK